jgi:REP element-mobilizing transposase RayT
MKGISERYEIVIGEIGFDQNYIHIFCGSHPSMAPMTILSIIKSITAKKIP